MLIHLRMLYLSGLTLLAYFNAFCTHGMATIDDIDIVDLVRFHCKFIR